MSTLLLSGWSQPVDALAHLVDDPIFFDYSDYPNADAAIAALKKLSPRHAVAWSMGGQLLLRAMAAGALAPKHVTLIAAPMQFVSDGMFPPPILPPQAGGGAHAAPHPSLPPLAGGDGGGNGVHPACRRAVPPVRHTPA